MNNTLEIWKDVEGYKGIYQVSNHGRIRSLDRMLTYKTRYGVFQHLQRGKILKQHPDDRGYLWVKLHDLKSKKTVKVHRLVGEAFIPNPLNLPCLNHKDEDKTNNAASNLEWCTHAYNNSYGTHLQKISKALTGIHRSEETRKKISEARKGKRLSKETRQKLREATLAQWERKRAEQVI